MRVSIIFAITLFALACSSNTRSPNVAQTEAEAAKKAQPTQEPTPILLSSEQVITALKTGGIPVINEIVYDETTDPNNLLGRPGQYVGKINFLDKRIEKTARDKKGCTIEIFASVADMEPRKTYLEATLGPASPVPGKQYIYAHKNVLLRLEYALLPKDAAQYEQILKSL